MVENIENPNFRLKPVAEFLDGKHHFFIPSYQRGYRWDRKQVEDLLQDIWDFAKKNQCNNSFYCLQPIVVKAKNETKWVVIDGQQRLTTLYLLLNYIKKDSRTRFVVNSQLYDLDYDTRKTPDFANPRQEDDIDSYYIFHANKIIEQWFANKENEIDYSALEKVLFNKSKDVPQVKFIWYVIQNDDDLDAIKSFNNLNKGKIKLTNAELIKALFVLNHTVSINEFSFEWNEIENALHDDRFWRFLTNTDYNPATRIDLIFDFLTEKPKDADDDFSYRRFQFLYDGDTNNEHSEFWKRKDISNFKQVWEKVKSVYQLFVYWYEDNQLYHYIGYLLSIGVKHSDIYHELKDCSKKEMIGKLIELIRKHNNITKSDIDELSYNDRKALHKVLLLFNIETSAKMDGYRFPFDKYKTESWDIEHIASQTDNPLNEIKDKITWLGYVKELYSDESNWAVLKEKALSLLNELKDKGKDEGNKFAQVYNEIVQTIEPEDEYSIKDKDSIANLTLLDAGTNRGYRNAPFPTKRQIIIKKDTSGKFIPPCTKYIFLKYFTENGQDVSQWKNAWKESDGEAYTKKIHETIDKFLK